MKSRIRSAAFTLLLSVWPALAQQTVRAGIVAADSASDPSYAAETGGAWKGQNPTPLETQFEFLTGENPPGTDNGGVGFQPWNYAGGYHYPDFSPYGRLNHFIDGVDFAHSSYNNLGAVAFGLTNANVEFGGATARATRTFESPLAVGASVTLDFDNPVLAMYNPFIPDPAGFVIRLNSGGGPVLTGNGVSSRLGLFTTSGYIDGRWATTDAAGDVDSGLSSTQTTSGAQLRFTLTGTETYSLEILPLGGGAPLFTKSGTLANSGAGAIDTLEILMFSNGSGNGIGGGGGQPTGAREFFFNNLSVESPAVGNADYDDDGDVDGADLLVWQRTLGSTTELAADGNQNGTVDAADLALWKGQFGAPATTSAAVAVPEPTAAVAVFGAALSLFTAYRSRSRRRPVC